MSSPKDKPTIKGVPEIPVTPTSPRGYDAEFAAMSQGKEITRTTALIRDTLKMFLGSPIQQEMPLVEQVKAFTIPKPARQEEAPQKTIVIDIPIGELMKLVETCFRDLEQLKKIKSSGVETGQHVEKMKSRIVELSSEASAITAEMVKLGVSIDKNLFETVKTETLIDLMAKKAAEKTGGLLKFLNADKTIAIEGHLQNLQTIKQELESLREAVPAYELRLNEYEQLRQKLQEEIRADLACIEMVLNNKDADEIAPPEGPGVSVHRLDGVKITPLARVKAAFDMLKQALAAL